MNRRRDRLLRRLVSLALTAAAAPAAAAEPSGTTPVTSPVGGDNVQVLEGSSTVTGALQGQDGVRIQTLCTHCNSANIQVGGLSQDLVPIYRDGFPIVGGLATAFVLGVLPADSISEAAVVKGPGDARLSNAAAGGAIELVAATADEIPWFEHGLEAGSFGLVRVLTRLSGRPLPWAAGSLVFGHTQADPVDDDGDGWTDVPSVDRDFAEGALTLSPAEHHTLELGASFVDEKNLRGRGGFDAFRFVTEGRDSWTREDASFERREFRVGWELDLEGGGSVELRLLDATRDQRQTSQLTAIEAGFIEGATRFLPRFRITEDNRWGGLRFRRPLGLRFRLDAGAELATQEIDAVNVEPLDLLIGATPQPELALETVDLTSLYAEVGWAPSSAWDLQLGLRRDEADLVTRVTQGQATETRRSFGETSPRLTLRLFPARGLTLRLLFGRTFRPPKPILSEVCCGQRYQTTENVVPERGTTLGLEAAFVPHPRLRAGFYLARTDFDEHLLRLAGASQVFIQTYALANVPRARAERVEASLRWTAMPRLTLDGSASWLSFVNRGDPLVDVFVAPPSFGEAEHVAIRLERIPYQPRRSASLAARLTLPGDGVLSAQAGYTGSMAIQQFTRLPLNSELDTTGLRSTPGFWLVGLAASVPLNRQLELVASFENLTDRLQDDLGDPTTDFNWGPLAGRAARVGLRFRPER